MAALAHGMPAPALMTRRRDEDLVARLRAGDERAFAEIHDRYRPALERYARRIVSDAALAEDVVQEALAKAHGALRADDREMQLRPWLYRLVRNRALDELRRASGREVPMEDADAAFPAAAAEADPFHAVTRRARLHEVVTDIAALPERQRDVLLRREVEGLTHEEVAAELGITVRASKNLVNRARENLVRADRARGADCTTVRDALLVAHEGRRRASAHALRHVAACRDCRGYRAALGDVRRGMRVLSPAPLLAPVLGLATGWGALGAGGAAAVSVKVAAGAAMTAAVAGGAFEISHGLELPGDRATISVRSDVLAAALAPGDPVPAGTAIVSRKVTLAAGTTKHPELELPCPAGFRVAGLTPANGARVGYGYAPSTIVGASSTARVRFEPRRLAAAQGIAVGTLCKRPDTAGSLLAAPALAARKQVKKVCASRAYLYETPGRFVVGTVFRSQPVSIRTRDRTRRWTRVATDAGTVGWLRTSAICK